MNVLQFCRKHDLWVHYSRHGVFDYFDMSLIRQRGYINRICVDFSKWRALPVDVEDIFVPHRDMVQTSAHTWKPSNVTWFSQGDWLWNDSCSSDYKSVLVAIEIRSDNPNFYHVRTDEDFQRFGMASGYHDQNHQMFDFERVQRETDLAGVLFYPFDYLDSYWCNNLSWKVRYEVSSCVIWDMSKIGSRYLWQMC